MNKAGAPRAKRERGRVGCEGFHGFGLRQPTDAKARTVSEVAPIIPFNVQLALNVTLYHMARMQFASRNPSIKSRGRASRMAADGLDAAALCASGLCLAHCLLLPLAIASLPALSSVLDVPERFHVWMVVIAVPVSLAALVEGALRHRSRVPLLMGIVGLSLLAAGAFIAPENAETPLTVAGGVALGFAHITNWRRRRMHSTPE